MWKGKKNRSIFLYLIGVMCILVGIEIAILAGGISGGGVYKKLNQNEKDILNQKVINRSSYLQGEMLNKWSALSDLAKSINKTAERLEAEGKISFETLDESSVTAGPLILETVDKLTSALRTQQVTGVYLILNTHDLDQGIEDKPGIYLRDFDPLSKASHENGDILMERAPTDVVKELDIATSSSWRPRFEFKKENAEYYDFFYIPYQQAIHNKEEFNVMDMGYWGGKEHLYGTNYDMITYSIPLINEDGLPYGVVGISITMDYLNRLLPSSELVEGGKGNYVLAIKQEKDFSVKKIFANGSTFDVDKAEIPLTKKGDDYYIHHNNRTFYVSMEMLDIYNSNTPYSDQQWVLLGIVDEKDLFSFTNKIETILLAAISMMLIVGVGGSVIGSYVVARPIKRLTDEVIRADNRDEIILSRTNIVEIDRLAAAVEKLNQDVRNTTMKFTNILQMASVKVAGFEYNEETGDLFVSDNFFEVLLDYEVDTRTMSIEDFKRQFAQYKHYIMANDYDKKKYLYKIPDKDSFAYVSLWFMRDGATCSGIIENVTNEVMEKNIIEYERDHDALTGLLNRGAFVRRMNDLFNNRQKQIKIAALLMLDLDNLKYVNDNYGHEAGDNYIAKAAEVFLSNTPKNTIVSRISGDEFFIFFYGYKEEKAVIEKIHYLKRAINSATIFLLDKELSLKVSGGIAWYPRDSKSFEKLQHFADYAMYKMKHTNKGNLTEFNLEEYLQDSFKKEAKEELYEMIANRTLKFYFQPIVSSKDGSIFAYESLMRSFMPALRSPMEILKLAKEEGCLNSIEELTWELTLETFADHIEKQRISRSTRVFINSISNQILSDEKIKELEESYSDYLANVVLEVTEIEYMDENYHDRKAELTRRWNGKLALDDYGSGYNSERTLLLISPEFIKIDMEIVRDIDSDPDKCKIVENIVNYAHERDMKIIAEGIETIEELKQVIQLKVDYLQGFLLAKPQYFPPKIQEDVVKLIQYLNED